MKCRGFADKLQHLKSFKVVDFLDAAIAMEARGLDVIRMEAGQPVFPLPEPVQQAAQSAIATSVSNIYTASLGTEALRLAIARLYGRRYNIDLNPKRVVITTGSSAALAMLCDLLVNPGDSMLLPDPGYPCNANFVRRCNGTPITIAVDASQNYQLSADQVRQHWRADTAGVIVASPSNPTGDTLSAEELKELGSAVRERGGRLIVDEIYHGLNYSSAGDISILNSCDDAFVINSFSKYFGLPGWRLGWMVVPEDAIKPLEIMAQNFYISPPNISQQVALAALSAEAIAVYEQRREIFKTRRDFLVPQLQQLGFDIPHAPPGAFYIYAGIDQLATDSEQFCWQMLDKAHVAFTPGTDFGSNGARNHVRFSYTEELPRLQIAVERLARALEASRGI
ncbi:MAG: aminotransferase class I/II-fold pyridoxal phosphate-dependent enzyme [Porticoccaceae bacterium]|nr:aminotransferase class I/II-fold pyridoxal phosphate-dependent enzyme [Porticoccaceae bacterium]